MYGGGVVRWEREAVALCAERLGRQPRGSGMEEGTHVGLGYTYSFQMFMERHKQRAGFWGKANRWQYR